MCSLPTEVDPFQKAACALHRGAGDILVEAGEQLVGVDIESHQVASLIDELPILAVMGTVASGGVAIRGAAELRTKESDRIGALSENLRRMGAQIEEFDDGLSVRPGRLRGAKLHAGGDHRMAMSLTLAALIAKGASDLEGTESVAVSFPEFFDLVGQGSQV